MKKILIVVGIVIILIISNNQTSNIIIPNDSIRIRVIANSDSMTDQNIKKKVKKDLNQALLILLKDAKNIDDVRNILTDNLEGVKFTVEKSLDNEKFNVNYGNNLFPNKIYKGVEYKEGYYESLVVTIGEGKGDNWWCILFPPLCSLEIEEENIEEVEYKSFIKEIIDKYL